MQRARDMHPAFTPAQTPDAVLLRYLGRARDRLYHDACTINRAHFLRIAETPFDVALLTTGVLLPAHQWVGNVRVRVNLIGAGEDETLPLEFLERPTVTETGRVRPYSVVEPRVTAATPQDTITEVLALYPKHPQSWENITAVLVDYLPRLTPMARLSNDTDLAVDADDPLVDDLAHFMAKRGNMTPKDPIRTSDFVEALRNSRTTYINSLAERRKPKVRQIREANW